MIDDWTIAKLGQIRAAARESCDFVHGLHRDDFIADPQTHKACSMNLIIIGETARRVVDRVPDPVDRTPDIPWREMAGMRNRIAHDYERIDLDIVWDTVDKLPPELIAQIDAMLS